MTFRPAPLRAAAALAVGFVVVRVVYRVLFHGADGAGTVLLDLPAVRLPAPFAHVVLFGPVTTQGLADAALSAVPIAATILAFGLLNALIDVSRLFTRWARSGPLRGIARTLAVAWATLPSLAASVRSVRFAARLRGERAGVRMLAPLLERTLERATAVAAALELRGLAGRGLDGSCEHPVVLHDAAAAFGAREVVSADELSLEPGTLAVVSGPTGSGKSTLLRALSGLHTHLDGGSLTGTASIVGHDRRTVPPRDLAQRIGVVLQSPREAFAAERVADEIGLGLELRGVARVIVDARVREIASRVGIAHLLDRRVAALSAGEATLVAIAAATVDQPILLIVDEPLADLDSDFRARIVALLGALAHEAGVCVVVAEHRAAEFAGVADRWLRVAHGRVETGVAAPHAPPTIARATVAAGAAALTATELTVRRGDATVVHEATFELAAGEVVALTGPNGAGKSSLLTELAAPPRSAPVQAAGAVALVPDASDDLFVCETVAHECRRAERRAKRPGAASTRFLALLSLTGDDAVDRLSRHPRDLSAGERRCLAIALQTVDDPAVLLLDEPTRGLDPAATAVVARALGRLADAGSAVLVATHDPAFAAAIAGRTLTLRDGRLGAGAPVAEPAATHEPVVALAPPTRTTPRPASADRLPASRQGTRHTLLLLAANAVAAAAFLWPLVANALPAQAHAAVPYVALAVAPLAVLVVLGLLDGTVRSAHSLALLGTLAAIGAAIRIAGTGVGGVEALFVLLILAGRAYGPRFGLLLGSLSIAASSILAGGIGPWTPFQMFACAWVAAGAGLLPSRVRGWREIGMLALYGVVTSYVFGLLMNMWFWPFAVGAGTGISYVPGGSIGENLASFLVYSLVTSTATWDTLRAVTTVIGLVVVGRAVLAALRRAKPIAPLARAKSGGRAASLARR